MRPKVVEKTPEHYIVDCGYCEGSGEKYGPDDLSKKTCPICNGQTVNKITISDSLDKLSLIECPDCSGTGQKYGRDDLSMKKCSRCRGSGVELIDTF